jgi:hypothetical protein
VERDDLSDRAWTMARADADIDMREVARRVLREHGFRPDVPRELDDTVTRAEWDGAADLRHLAWSSIDNETSRDLDQLEYAERQDGGAIRLLVAIADVDVFVPKGCPIDDYAATNAMSLYTGVQTFPMLPEVLSHGDSSLLEHQERLAMVTEMVVRPARRRDPPRSGIRCSSTTRRRSDSASTGSSAARSRSRRSKPAPSREVAASSISSSSTRTARASSSRT